MLIIHYNVLTKAYVRRYNDKEGDPNFNYGGAKLHNLFWSQLQNQTGNKPGSGAVKEMINKILIHLMHLKKKFLECS